MSAGKCPKCGLYNPDTALRCDCGYDFSSGTMQQSYVPAHQRPFDERPMSVGQWLGTLVVASIPLVGLVVLFCWAFGAGNLNRKNWSRAALLLMLILLGIYMLLLLLSMAVVL